MQNNLITPAKILIQRFYLAGLWPSLIKETTFYVKPNPLLQQFNSKRLALGGA